MCRKYSILIRNGLIIIHFSSIIGRKSPIFYQLICMFKTKILVYHMTPYLQVWFSVLSLVLSIIFIKVLDGSNFELYFSICSRRKFLSIIYFSRSTEVKIKLSYVSQVPTPFLSRLISLSSISPQSLVGKV